MIKNDIRWKQRFENYEKAYLSLIKSQQALNNDSNNKFIQDSLIQRYEYTVELAWKTIKDYLEYQGFIDVTSPKKVMRKAFSEKIITDGERWMEALNDINRTSHAYEESMATDVAFSIVNNHIPLFKDLYAYFKAK